MCKPYKKYTLMIILLIMGKICKWIEIAKTCNHIPPDTDIMNRAIYVTLQSDELLRAFYFVEEQWPMSMIWPKQLIKEYVKKYDHDLYVKESKKSTLKKLI